MEEKHSAVENISFVLWIWKDESLWQEIREKVILASRVCICEMDVTNNVGVIMLEIIAIENVTVLIN